jgi:hypothetical protein
MQTFFAFSRLRGMASIVVSGDVLRRPRAGNLAAHLHYLIGLRKLGHEVIYLEEREPLDAGAGAAAGAAETVVPREGLVLLGEVLRRCRVDVPVVWVDSDAGLVGGMVWPQLRRRLEQADLLLDIGGHCWLKERSLPRRRALIDIGELHDSFESPARQTDHELFFSNRRDPDEQLAAEWLPTIPPVVPRLWYGPPARAELPLKVLVERGLERGGLGPQGDGGVEQLLALPARVSPRPWTALPDDGSELAQQLAAAGWSVRTEAAVDASLSAYRAQMIGSQACLSFRSPSEHGVWFTAHDAAFLAAGRPLIVGDSGLDHWLPTGTGVISFTDLDGAVEGVELVARELPRHAAAARDVAERVFHYKVVLPNLLEQALPRHLQAVA